MEKRHSVFVGYFRRDFGIGNITAFLREMCDGVDTIEIIDQPIGLSGSVYCAKLTFVEARAARQAIALFNHGRLDGNRLVAWSWRTRTAANERRNVFWRNTSRRQVERRKKDRRRYVTPEITFRNSGNLSMPLDPVQVSRFKKALTGHQRGFLGLGSEIKVRVENGLPWATDEQGGKTGA